MLAALPSKRRVIIFESNFDILLSVFKKCKSYSEIDFYVEQFMVKTGLFCGCRLPFVEP